jgi:ribonuclease BN (tRNA processing enzyme)
MFESHVEDAFALKEYDRSGSLEIGALRVRFHPVPHFVPAQAVELADASGRLTFSSDCGPNAQLCEFAQGTDLLLIEASLPEGAAEPGDERGHLTPREAGEHARRAGARRVVLTHLSDELDQAAARSEAEAAFGGAVEIAAERAVFTL